jgi:hypothetical protein
MLNRCGALVAMLLVLPGAAGADVQLPPGFTAQVYVTGERFDSGTMRGLRGIPSSSTLAFDLTGVLYLARTGRRYSGGEIEDIWPVYRIPRGGGRLTPDTESRFLHGPPLPNPQVSAVGAAREIFVTTFDRDRRVGGLYRLSDGRAEYVAGGGAPPGASPLFVQPEAVVADSQRNLYVADRERGVIVKLDPAGRVLDPRWVAITRPRVLAIDGADRLWIGSDAGATAPWQQGPGEIWRVGADREPRLVLRGPLSQAISLSPAGTLFLADRQGARIAMVAPGGGAVDFARFGEGDAPRALGFAPETPETRRAGFAGDLFVIVINRGAWPVNEVVRISGPFRDWSAGETRRD